MIIDANGKRNREKTIVITLNMEYRVNNNERASEHTAKRITMGTDP